MSDTVRHVNFVSIGILATSLSSCNQDAFVGIFKTNKQDGGFSGMNNCCSRTMSLLAVRWMGIK
jgi:hypothetical protein